MAIYEAPGSFVLWSLDNIVADLASHQGVVKGYKKAVQQSSSKSQYIHTSSYVRTWSCYNPKELQQQCELKVVYDNLKKKTIVQVIHFKLKSSYIDDKDNLAIYYVVIPCVVMSLLIHPITRHHPLNRILWAFCVYLEAVSVLPQLRVMQNTKIVEPFTAHYAFALGVARFLSCAHWVLQVFSFDVVDSDGGEIRATCFNAVADQFHNVIEAGKEYRISRGSIKPSQNNFNHLRNDQELTLDTFNYHPLVKLKVWKTTTLGMPTTSIMKKNGTGVHKRTLKFKDMSGRKGQRLQTICHAGEFPVLATKAVRLNDFNGKSVRTIATNGLKMKGKVSQFSISREMSNLGKTDVWKTISQIKDEKLGTSEKPDWIFFFVTVSHIKVDNFYYPGCPLKIGDRKCNKKVTNNADGTWHCERCNQSIDACDFRSGSCSGETIKRQRGFDLERPAERDIFYGGCDEHEAGLSSYTALERCKISNNNDDGYDEDMEVDLTLSIGGGSQVNNNKNSSSKKPYLLPLGCSNSPNGKTRDLNSSVSFQSDRVGDFSDPTTPMKSSSVTFDQERKGPHWLSQEAQETVED
ncbi:Replication protein A DNA-binding subunit E [Glycine soja]